MPNGPKLGPFFRILPHKVEMAPGVTVYGYLVEMNLLLWVADEQPRFYPFTFHLDTKSDVTTVPEQWLAGNRRRFGVLSRPITA